MKYIVLILFLAGCSIEEETIDSLENIDLSDIPENSSISISITKFIINILPTSFGSVGTGK